MKAAPSRHARSSEAPDRTWLLAAGFSAGLGAALLVSVLWALAPHGAAQAATAGPAAGSAAPTRPADTSVPDAATVLQDAADEVPGPQAF